MSAITLPPNNYDPKDTKFIPQYSKTFAEFFRKPQSMLMVSRRTGIERASICRYCRHMRISGLIAVAKRDRCEITGEIVNYYTTNPALMPIKRQLTLFP